MAYHPGVIVHCPSCGKPFEAPGDELTSSLACPSCGRRVVLRASRAASPVGDQTVPFDPATVPAPGSLLTPRPTPPVLSLPRDGRVSVAVMSGPRRGQVRVLDGPRLVIGREGGPADLTVPDPEVSRQHAALECYGERVVLRDLGSRNGSFVGRARVDARELSDQAEFRLGLTDFLLIVTERG